MSRLPIPLLPRRLRWVGVLGVVTVIVYFSLLTNPPSTPSAGPFWDKKLHFAAYGALTLALAYATVTIPTVGWPRVLFVVAVSVLFGVGIELTQYVLPTRFFSPADMLANVVGTILAAAWFLLEPRLRYRPITFSPGTNET